MQVEPKLTKKQVTDWCPKPRGTMEPGNHDKVPGLTKENADAKALAENRQLTKEIAEAFRRIKDPNAKTPQERRFVIQWRMFANADNPNIYKVGAEQCGCGCSCSCG